MEITMYWSVPKASYLSAQEGHLLSIWSPSDSTCEKRLPTFALFLRSNFIKYPEVVGKSNKQFLQHAIYQENIEVKDVWQDIALSNAICGNYVLAVDESEAKALSVRWDRRVVKLLEHWYQRNKILITFQIATNSDLATV